jgi:hypothetical protein
MRYLVLLLALAACRKGDAPAPQASAPADTTPKWVLSATSFGKVKTGISLAELNSSLNEQLVPAYQMNPTCDYIYPAAMPDSVAVMVENDTVVRFDVESPGIRTVEGAGVGDLEADVVKLYGAGIEVSPHKYTGPEGHYLTVTPPGDTLHQIIFETDGQKVVHMRAGSRPAVEYVEGCA